MSSKPLMKNPEISNVIGKESVILWKLSYCNRQYSIYGLVIPIYLANCYSSLFIWLWKSIYDTPRGKGNDLNIKKKKNGSCSENKRDHSIFISFNKRIRMKMLFFCIVQLTNFFFYSFSITGNFDSKPFDIYLLKDCAPSTKIASDPSIAIPHPL